MTSTRRTIAVILTLGTLLWTAFIFCNSLKDSDDSQKQSSRIVDIIIEKILSEQPEEISEKTEGLLTLIVRKSAHFLEFSMLSFFSYLTLCAWKTNSKNRYILPVAFSFFVACCDEMLQYFTPGRACRFTDVIIDTSGAVFALAIVSVITEILLKSYRSRGKNE